MTGSTAYALYGVFALGAIAMFLLLPQPQRSRPLVGAVAGLAALALLLVVLATRVATADTTVYFYLFAALAIASAARVISHPRPVYSALYFVLTVIAVAALLVLQHAEFLAVALIIIYAGAILVTYLFVIMLAHQGGSAVYDRRAREPLWTVLICFLLMANITTRAAVLPPAASPKGVPVSSSVAAGPAQLDGPPATFGNTAAVGATLMSRYIVAIQMAGVLLLISLVGAIALSRRKVRSDVPPMSARPLGQIGREVQPF